MKFRANKVVVRNSDGNSSIHEAPWILRAPSEISTPQLVIGNFDPERIRDVPALPGLETVRDFGDGLRLLRKATR